MDATLTMLAVQFSAMTDGLAIQVLLNDTVMTPQRMYDICLESPSV